MANEPPNSGSKNIAPSGDNSASFAPGLLADLTRALLPFLGPYSITTVKRASRTCENNVELLRHIVSHIDDIAKREMYMKSGMRIMSDFNQSVADKTIHSASPPLGGKYAADVPPEGNRTGAPITAELAKLGEIALAPIIGPIAGVLVSRYAKASQNSREFYERLAGHLRTPEERDSFFLSVRRGGESWRPQ